MTGTKLFSRLISVALAFALALALLPGAARAATVTTEVGDFTVTTDVVNGYTYRAPPQDGALVITRPGSYTIAMKSGVPKAIASKIQIDSGPVDITLDGVWIENGFCAFDLERNAVVSLALKAGTTSTLQSGGNFPGIYCRSGAALTIAGPGKLTATGGEYGAGIGGGAQDDCGTITINGGTITATGGDYGAGIGGGLQGYGGTITINGGIVSANGGSQGGAGIGGGFGANGGRITIGVGTITATGGQYGAGIGGGRNGSGDTLTISGGTIMANGGSLSAGIGGGYEGGRGTVIITGGSVKAVGDRNGDEGIGKGKEGTDSGSLTNGSAPVYLTTVTLAGVNAETAVSALTCDAPYTYGMQDVKTDNEGKLYLYLPLDTKTTRASAGGYDYAGEVLTSDNAASSQGTLSRVYANDSPGYLHQTLQDPATGVSLTGYFEPGARLTITPKALHAEGTCAACDAIRERQRAGDALALNDIAVSGAYSGNLEVQLPVGAAYNGQTVTILHCASGRLETYTAVVQEGRAVFSVNSLSPFAAFLQEGLLGIPKTGDNSGTGLWLALIGAALALAGLAIWRLGSYSWTASEHTIASAR